MAEPVIPSTLIEYVSLSELFDRLGKQQFRSEWTGAEAEVLNLIPHDEALRIQAQLDAERLKLPQHEYETDDDYIAAIVAEDEVTDSLKMDFVSGDDEFALLVYRIYRLSEQLSELPPLNDEEAYRAQHQSYLRRKSIEYLITELLKQGALTAHHAGPTQREQIPIAKWGAENLRIDIGSGSANIGGEVHSHLSFPRVDVEQTVRKLARSLPDSAASEAAAKATLVTWMNEGPRKLKDNAWSEIKGSYPDLPQRRFDIIWAEAARETGSGWNRSGRPKSSH